MDCKTTNTKQEWKKPELFFIDVKNYEAQIEASAKSSCSACRVGSCGHYCMPGLYW